MAPAIVQNLLSYYCPPIETFNSNFCNKRTAQSSIQLRHIKHLAEEIWDGVRNLMDTLIIKWQKRTMLFSTEINKSNSRNLNQSAMVANCHSPLIETTDGFADLITRSAAMQSVIHIARCVANSTANVLINGESGTGKEVLARSIHENGNRKHKPFTAINCSAIPENLLESELFGHAKGSFTGAIDTKIGIFEEADGGTLFLDEIGDLNFTLQAKLLRVIQERKIKRIGENRLRPVNVRIIAATHKDLQNEISSNRFREDLFFRLNVISIKIPPLRERIDDIIPLTMHFLNKFCIQNNVHPKGLTPAAIQLLLELPWKGNIRELENTIERAVVLSNNSKIDVTDIIQTDPAHPADKPSLNNDSELSLNSINPVTNNPIFQPLLPDKGLPSLSQFNLLYINYVMKLTNGVKEQAAHILDIDRKTLYRRLKDINESESKLNDFNVSNETIQNHSDQLYQQ